MALTLRTGLSYGVSGGRPVFLDRARDRYFLLPHQCEAAFFAIQERQERAADCEALERLIRCGVLVDDPNAKGVSAPMHADRPTTSAIEVRQREAAVRHLFAGGLALWRTSRLLRRGLDAALARLERKQRNVTACGQLDDLMSAAAIFHDLTTVVTPNDQCLLRSLALKDFLLSRALPSQLVIGVALRPFVAHSWVQSGTIVLNDRLEHAQRYAPVLVI